MLNFPEEFFEAEVREDFYIEEIVKRYWACCMECVRIIDETCKRHGLTYYANWGTLLGTIRHKGFVPWDDDIDLMMKRPDYQKLMEVLPKEMPEGYVLSNCFINEAHKQIFAGLANGSELVISKELLDKRYGCPFVCTIDIFPLDYLPRNEDEAEIVRDIFIIIWSAIELIKKEAEPEEIEKAVQDVEECCRVKLNREKPLRSQLWKLASQLVMSYNEDEADYLVDWCSYTNRGYKLKKEWLDEVVYMPFENMMMPVPKEYEQVLVAMYGDWNKRVRGTSGHDYPAFLEQLDFLRKTVKELKAENGEK